MSSIRAHGEEGANDKAALQPHTGKRLPVSIQTAAGYRQAGERGVQRATLVHHVLPAAKGITSSGSSETILYQVQPQTALGAFRFIELMKCIRGAAHSLFIDGSKSDSGVDFGLVSQDFTQRGSPLPCVAAFITNLSVFSLLQLFVSPLLQVLFCPVNVKISGRVGRRLYPPLPRRGDQGAVIEASSIP
ncbi:hypothetical protein E2C01_056109 [Portunus trituberculatus]|uniref:Uncharacterized protein n=1 Tax=Portunus trituberculatus TaxID=210409 RepID=A0A5B7GX00_PORTR|nr:hypothetical protein [Portunus trituberculatus]